MRVRSLVGIASLMTALAALPAGAATPKAAAAIAHNGNAHGAPACSACHGVDGQGQAAAGFPRLAGLNATYLLHQLEAFADGSRASAVMAPVAKALGTDERKALADDYAALPPPASVVQPAPAISGGAGEQLALHGRWSADVPSCVACHGPRGEGVGAGFPPLAGQPAGYLANQLDAFKSGARHNDPLGLMQHVASALSEQDIKAVSAWFAAQPVTPRGGKP
ncbi:MAG TPA: c-type cytochrome [Rhodanobacteraceae bacterium]